MTNSVMRHIITNKASKWSHNFTQSQKIIVQYSGSNTLFFMKPISCGLWHGRFWKMETLENEGVSKLTAELTSDSCEWKSISNYQSAWIKSASYSVMMERWSVQNFWNWNYYFPFFLKNGMIKFRCFAIDCYFCLAYTKIDFMWCFV